MNQLKMFFSMAVFSLIILGTGVAFAQEVQPSAAINASKTGAPINELIYGKFTELLSNQWEKGLWAEMLSDRKFFYPVDSSAALVPQNTRRGFNRWRPVGPDNSIEMDREHAYVGKHSPRVRLDAQTQHGMRQSVIPIRKGKEYTGRIVLAGDSGASVSVSLVWGAGQNDRQTVRIGHLSGDWTTVPLRFAAGADADSARFEITGVGAGSFTVGAVSLMPADNINGFRPDIIALLRQLDAGTYYRWPGGNQISQYDWREGIGNPDKRPPHYDLAWFAPEYNDVGTDEFMVLCNLLDIEPFMTVNAGLHDEYSAAGWVEYCNGGPDTPMGKLRALNGHPAPYNVRMWGVGNEPFGEWQWGFIPVPQFVEKHNLFVNAMRKVDPDIVIIAGGATTFEMSETANNHRPGGSGSTSLPPLNSDDHRPYEYGSIKDWDGWLLAHCADNIDIVSEHFYPRITTPFNYEKQDHVPSNDPMVDQIRRVPNRVQCVYEAWQEYLKRMPELSKRNITFSIDEWAGAGGQMTRALCVGETMHEMFRHSDLISMAGYTSMISCLSFNAYDAVYSPIGLAYLLYREHFGSIPVEVTGNSPQHEVLGTVGVDKPAATSGSDTYPLDVAAAFTEDRRRITVAVCNPTDREQPMTIGFTGVTPGGTVRMWQLAGATYDVQNAPGKPPAVSIMEIPVRGIPDRIVAPPISISIYEFEVR